MKNTFGVNLEISEKFRPLAFVIEIVDIRA